MDQHLKRSFEMPKTPETSLDLRTKSGVPSLTVKPDASGRILYVDVYYTQQGQMDGLRDDRNNTINRFWHHATAAKHGDTWTAELPLLSVDKPLWAYANVVYPLEEPITGAGYYYGVYTTDKFNLSSLVRIVAADELKAAGVKATLKPSLTIETFKGDWEKEWFTYKPADWARKTHKMYDPRWIARDAAKLALDVRAEKANKLVIGIDRYAAEVELTGGTGWQNITLSAADFTDAVTNALPGWTAIKEFRFAAAEHLRARKRGDKTTRLVGAHWKGKPPEFRNLRWIGEVE